MFKARTAVKFVDKGWKALRQTAKNLREAQSYAKAGVLGDSKKNHRRGDEITNVELAMVHEFGSPKAHVPARSFVRATFDKNRIAYISLLRQLVPKIYELKMDAKQVLGILGAKMAADMKNAITEGDGIPPPNTPEVFMRKLLGSKYAQKRFNVTGTPPRPLVDTGQLVSSITWAVVLSGQKKGHGGGGHGE